MRCILSGRGNPPQDCSPSSKLGLFCGFGVVLGLGYLTKALYLPLSFVFLGAALLVGGMSRRSVLRVALATLTFAVVAGPFVFALSKAKHRFTYGDVGRIAYATYVQNS